MDTEIFKDHLRNILGRERRDKLKEILEDYNAIIAGGFVLNAYHDYKDSFDIDIYVSMEKSVEFYERIVEDLKLESNTNMVITPAYDDSFLRKNKILARQRLLMKFPNIPRTETYFDIMVVSDTSSPMEVVNNFDLSFCEIWYNAKDDMVECKGSSEDILNKKGILNPDYVQSLIKNSNKFILSRIKKYKKRGFEITIPPTNINIVIEKNSKKVTDAENWVATKTLELTYKSFFPNIPFVTFLINAKFELDYNMKKLKKFVSKYFIEYDSEYDPSNNINTIENFRAEQFYYKITRIIQTIFRYTKENPNIKNIYEKYNKYFNNYLINLFTLDLAEKIVINEAEILKKNCADIIDMGNPVISEQLIANSNIIIFVNPEEIMCFDVDYMNSLITIDNIFYECLGRLIPVPVDEQKYEQKFDRALGQYSEDLYVKIPIDSKGLNGLVKETEFKKMLYNKEKNGKSIFYIEPALDDNMTQFMLTHSISYRQAHNINANFVSANHCQHGSSFLVYTIKECKRNCVDILSLQAGNQNQQPASNQNH